MNSGHGEYHDGSMPDQIELRAQLLGAVERILPIVASHAAWAEQHGRIHDEVLRALIDAQVPRLFLPTRLGGLAVDPVTCALVCERLADADPSAAWYVMVYNSARLLGAHWPEQMVRALWGNDPDLLAAASGHTPLRGERVDGGFRVSGRNGFVSGAPHADFMLAPLLVDGRSYFAALPMAQCRIVDNWNALGMRGTGSNDVEVEDVFLAEQFTVATDVPAQRNSVYADVLYRCPSRVVFATYVPVALSLARQALDFLSELAADKVPYATDRKLANRGIAQVHYGKALAIYRSARGYFLDTLDRFWRGAKSGVQFTDEERADLYLAGTHALQASAEVVRHVADAAGSSSFNESMPLARIQRDMETLRHHGFANEARFGSVAQVHWGVELDYPLLLR